MRPESNTPARRSRYLVGGKTVPYSDALHSITYPTHCVVGQHQPAQRGSNLCAGCTDQLRSDLRLIEDRWENLEDALMTVRQKSNGERAGSSDEGSAPPIDLTISEAMGDARNAVWAIIASISRDHLIGRDGKPVLFRTDEGTWALAGMLGRYYVDYIATHPDQDFTERAYRMTWSAGRKVEDAVHPPNTRQSLDSHCHQWITTDEGGRAPCPGQLEGVVRWDGAQVVECSEDPMHMVPMDQWLMLQSRRDKLATKYAAQASRLVPRQAGKATRRERPPA